MDVIDALFASIKLRDELTAEHSVIMAHYSYHLALVHDKENAEMYYAGSLVHDVGKLAMNDSVLKGNQILSAQERQYVKKHVKDGVGILTELEMPQLVIDIARYHHERYDGSGYLEGLQGKEIPLAGRISAVADTFAALITERPYQKKRDCQEAITIMLRDRSLFDPDILDSFIEIVDRHKPSEINV
jgi:putative two-component system response regulator